jgi:hypothetical protein
VEEEEDEVDEREKEEGWTEQGRGEERVSGRGKGGRL